MLALSLLAGGSALIVALRPAAATIATYTIPLGQRSDLTPSIVLDAHSRRAFVPTWVIGSAVGYISMLETTHNTLLRAVPVSIPFGTPAVDERRGHVFVPVNAANGTVVEMLDTRNGRLLHTTSVGFDAGPAIDNRSSHVFVLQSGAYACPGAPMCSNGTGNVSVLDAVTGRSLRHFTIPGQGDSGKIMADEPQGRLILIRRNPLNNTAMIDTLDTTNGRLVRQIAVPLPGGSYWRSPVVDAPVNRVFVAIDNVANGGPLNTSDLYVLDARSGTVVRHLTIRRILGDMAVDERLGHVYATSYGATALLAIQRPGGFMAMEAPAGAGEVRVLDARTGALLQTIPIKSAAANIAVDRRRERLFVVSAGLVVAGPAGLAGIDAAPGTVSVLDEHGGRLLGTATVGVNPGAIAVDERTGRAYVVDNGGLVRPADDWKWVPGGVRRLLPFVPPPPGRPMVNAPVSVTVVDATRV